MAANANTRPFARPVSGPLYVGQDQRRARQSLPEAVSSQYARPADEEMLQHHSQTQVLQKQPQMQQLYQQQVPRQPYPQTQRQSSQSYLQQSQATQSSQSLLPSPKQQPKAKAQSAEAPVTKQKPAEASPQPPPPPPPPPQDDVEPQLTYNAERVIGNGTFGIVYSAHIVETDETVAIKKVFVDRRYRNRELQVWREMRHPNIVRLKHAFYTSGDTPDELYLNMVMEFMPETVYCVMKRFCKQKQQMPRIIVQLYTYQACRALAHLHASNVVHRDIKPQNLLVDAQRGHLLKLCDFGSAAVLERGPKPTTLVAYICSRYYRAPELIFGTQTYTTAVDIWSIGCVLAEMLRGRPLFPGENGVDQLIEIVKVLGSPTPEEVVAMNPQYSTCKFPLLPARGWSTVFRAGVGEEFLSILTDFLQYSPEARKRPLEACAHPCFDSLRDQRTRCPDGQPLPTDLFNLTSREQRECSPSLQERLVPAWHSARTHPGSPAPPQAAG